MRVVIKNNGQVPVRTPWPWRGEVPAGQTQEFTVEDRGFPVLSALSLAMMAQKMENVTVRIFKGNPEKEYEVVHKGGMPSLVEKQ